MDNHWFSSSEWPFLGLWNGSFFPRNLRLTVWLTEKKLCALSAMGFSIFLSVFLCKPAGLAVHCENLLFHWWAIMAVCISNKKILSFFGERNKNLASRINKPWVFQVNEIRSMSEPEKLKVCWWEKPNLFEWTEKTQDFLMRDANCHNCKSMNW